MNEVMYAEQMQPREEVNLPGIPGILIISEDKDVHTVFEQAIDLNRYQILSAQSQTDALSCLKSKEVAIVILDIEKATRENVNLVSFIKRNSPSIEVVAIAPPDKIRIANQSIRYGATLYLVKPLEIPDVKAVLKRAADFTILSTEKQDLEHRAIADFMGGCDSMNRLLKLAEKVAPTTSTVLISGETGTGKEILARVIHRLSGRKDERFIAVNCGAIPESLFESELFGYKKGSFTGADKYKVGLVESADHGTLFLD